MSPRRVAAFALAVLLTAFSAPFALAQDEPAPPAVQAEFERFAQNWIVKLARMDKSSAEQVEILPQADGSYLARYRAIDAGSVSCQAKKTGLANSPYVGLLIYNEEVMECAGPDPESARRGQFTVAKTVRITEIFGHNGKGWR